MSACVLPVAPEFQDPPPAQNYPPIFIDADPPLGSLITSTRPVFKILVRDPNNDPLHVSWLADYPPRTQDTRPLNILNTPIAAPLDPTQPVELDDPKITCESKNLAPQLPYHRIQLYVTDGEFLDPQEGQPFRYDLVAPGRFVVQATWIWNMECLQP